MSWDTLSWTPADPTNPEGGAAILDLVPLFKSALDEALSALLMGSVTITAVDVASAPGDDLPAGLAPISTFELLGTARRSIWVGAAPDASLTLGGGPIDIEALGRCLIDGVDGALVSVVGEGLAIGEASNAEVADGELVLFRLTLTDGEGGSTQLVLGVDRATPVEFSTHIVALQALGGEVAHATVSGPAGAPPVAAAASMPAVAAGMPHGAAATALPSLPANVHPLAFDELGAASPAGGSQSIEMLLGVSLQVTVEIGRTKLPIREVLALTPGSIVELDKLAGEKVDVLVNGHRIASGEVVVVDDNFGVRVTDVVSRQRRILSADGAA